MTLRRGAIVLIAWGLLDGAMTVLQTPFKTRAIMHAMLGTASVVTILTGLVVWMLDRRRREGEPLIQAITETSLASGLTAAGVAVLMLGGGFGYWLALIAAGMIAFGVGGLMRETLTRRRDVREIASLSEERRLSARLYEQPGDSRAPTVAAAQRGDGAGPRSERPGDGGAQSSETPSSGATQPSERPGDGSERPGDGAAALREAKR